MALFKFFGKAHVKPFKEPVRAASGLDLGFQQLVDELAAAVFNADGLRCTVFTDGELLAVSGIDGKAPIGDVDKRVEFSVVFDFFVDSGHVFGLLFDFMDHATGRGRIVPLPVSFLRLHAAIDILGEQAIGIREEQRPFVPVSGPADFRRFADDRPGGLILHGYG